MHMLSETLHRISFPQSSAVPQAQLQTFTRAAVYAVPRVQADAFHAHTPIPIPQRLGQRLLSSIEDESFSFSIRSDANRSCPIAIILTRAAMSPRAPAVVSRQARADLPKPSRQPDRHICTQHREVRVRCSSLVPAEVTESPAFPRPRPLLPSLSWHQQHLQARARLVEHQSSTKPNQPSHLAQNKARCRSNPSRA